jgi:hypothetical protein
MCMLVYAEKDFESIFFFMQENIVIIYAHVFPSFLFLSLSHIYDMETRKKRFVWFVLVYRFRLSFFYFKNKEKTHTRIKNERKRVGISLVLAPTRWHQYGDRIGEHPYGNRKESVETFAQTHDFRAFGRHEKNGDTGLRLGL